LVLAEALGHEEKSAFFDFIQWKPTDTWQQRGGYWGDWT